MAAMIHLLIRFPSGGACQIIARPTDVLRDLKTEVARWGNISTNFAFTKPSGLPIQDDATVQDCAIDGSTLHVREAPHPFSVDPHNEHRVATRYDSTVMALADEFTVRLAQLSAENWRRVETEGAQRLQDFARKLQCDLDEQKRTMEAKLREQCRGREERILADEARLAECQRGLSAREAQLNAAIAHFQQQTEEMQRYVMEERVKLNVGGQLFVTTRTTLTKHADSFFAVLLSGRFDVRRDQDGSIFIDRAPEMFQYVLEYMRDDVVSVEQPTEVFMRRLRREFEFFGLPPPRLDGWAHERPHSVAVERPSKQQRIANARQRTANQT